MAAASKKKESKKEETAQKAETALEQLMLDCSYGKYGLVGLTSAWALELRRREEYRHLAPNDILELALQDIMSGKVSNEEVRNCQAAAEAQAKNAAESKEKK